MQKTFADLGRVDAIRELFEGTGFAPFGEPLGYKTLSSDTSVSASRLLQEGLDFNLVYFPLKHLGYKAALAVTGELYASLARPKTLSVNLAVSAKLDFEQIRELWSGVVSAATEHGYESLSLDLQPSGNGLQIGVCASGAVSHLTSMRRSEPKSKDLVCVSGSLGAAYLGLRLLEKERLNFEAESSYDEDALKQHKMLVAAYLKPELQADIVQQLEDAQIYPTAGYFVTRGLSDAVLRLSRDCGLGAKIYADKIPFEGGSFSVGKNLDLDPVSAAMNGGDDFKLLFTVPIMKTEVLRKDFQTFDIIGHLAREEAGAVLVTPEGVELPLTAQGWKDKR